jgi:hypothetical protein
MPERSIKLNAILARLECVEKENRRLKRVGALLLLGACAVVLMGQTAAKRTIIADEFILKDSAGVVRATLGFQRSEPTLTLFDSNGQKETALGPEAISFGNPGEGHVSVLLGTNVAISYQMVEGKAQVLDQGPGLSLNGNNKQYVVLRALSEDASLHLSNGAVLMSGTNGPSLTLSDAQGFQAVIGSVSTRTPSNGVSSKTSAALWCSSIRMARAFGMRLSAE